MASYPLGGLSPGWRLTCNPPTRKSFDLGLASGEQGLRGGCNSAADAIQIRGQLPDTLVSERLVDSRNPCLDLPDRGLQFSAALGICAEHSNGQILDSVGDLFRERTECLFLLGYH